MMYSEALAQEILDRIHEKGWNAYNASNLDQTGVEGMIQRSPTQKLMGSRRYVLMPKIPDSTTPQKVMGAVQKSGPASITIGYKTRELRDLELRSLDVRLTTPYEDCVSYKAFMAALKTVTSLT